MTLFKNKYRIESTRLPEWDYGNAGYYYVTICTKDRAHFFGDVVAEDVALSEIGAIVAEEWLKTEMLRDNVELDEWIVMPNHVHLILRILYKIQSSVDDAPTGGDAPAGRLYARTITNPSGVGKMGGEYVGVDYWAI